MTPELLTTAVIADRRDQPPGARLSERFVGGDGGGVTPERTAPPSFATLVGRHGDAIYRYAWQLTRNQIGADDLYRETMRAAFRSHGTLDGEADHRSWLYRIASRAFINARDLPQEMDPLVSGLLPTQRIALILRKYHGLGYGEIATTLNTSEMAVRADVYAALRTQRGLLADRLEE